MASPWSTKIWIPALALIVLGLAAVLRDSLKDFLTRFYNSHFGSNIYVTLTVSDHNKLLQNIRVYMDKADSDDTKNDEIGRAHV